MTTPDPNAYTEVFYVLDTGKDVCRLIEEGHHYTNKAQALKDARAKNCGVLQLTRKRVPASAWDERRRGLPPVCVSSTQS